MRLLLILLLFLLPGCRPPETVATSPIPFSGKIQEFRIATWNVRNFFDSTDNPYNDEVPSTTEYDRKTQDLSLVIGSLDADFLALEEVENLEALKKLNSTLKKPYPQIGLIEGNDTGRGIDVAFLSRIPVKAVVSHADHDLPERRGVSRGYRFSRDCLEVEMQTDPPLTIFVNHLKAARGDEKKSAAKRRVQAEGIMEILQTTDSPGEAQLVVGDLNDVPESWALEPLFSHLKDPFALMTPSERATHYYHKKGSAIDHILADEEAFPLCFNAKVWSKVAWNTSDHSPISVQMKLKVPSGLVEEKTWKSSSPKKL